MNGLYTPSMNILCKKEVLGRSYEAKIAGIDVQICFPRYPVECKSDSEVNRFDGLEAPTVGARWKRGNEKLSWGYPMRYPSGDSCVELLAIVVPETGVIEEQAGVLYRGIEKWDEKFIDYMMLETKTFINGSPTVFGGERRLELMAPAYIPNNREIVINAMIPKEADFASQEQIRRGIRFASSGKELLLEYQMLLLSYKAKCNYQNRPAIIDACSALEVCLVRFLEKRLDELKYDKNWYIKQKFRSLGDRIRFVQDIDKSFPKMDYDGLVVKPRNALVHNRDAFPSDNTTIRLIKCVETCLEHFSSGDYY